MSESESSGAGQREVAYRIFAAEFEAADYDYSESDEERAPNYVITPTGARANRLFAVGVLTEIEQVSDDVLRARVVDPTGAFVLYAGQYQPDEQAFLEKAQPPMFVAVTGKARTFQPDDSDQVFTSVRPESISEVDDETRDRWVVQTAEQTVERIRWMTTALTVDSEDIRAELGARGADDGLAHGIELALEHYGTTPTYLDRLREMALDATRVVAGETDEIEEFTAVADERGDVTAADLAAQFTLPEAADAADTDTATEDTDQTAPGEASDTEVDAPSSDAVPSKAESATTEPASASSQTETEPTTSGHDDSPSESAGETTVESQPVDAADTPEQSEESPTSQEDSLEPATDSSDELGDFEPEEFELEEETREEIEEEFGTEFQSGTEVDDPGSADIETPDPEKTDAEAESEPASTDDAVEGTPSGAEDKPTPEQATARGAAETDSASSGTDTEESTGAEASGDDGAEPEDPAQAAVDLMSELDEGDGADREQLLTAMTDRYGIDREGVEEAIQSALMDGKCYEPADGRLKPI